MIPAPLFSWLNVLAFAACMSGPSRIHDSMTRVYAAPGLRVESWTVSEDVLICVSGDCALPVPPLCRMFDADGDGVVTLRDWSRLSSSVVWCDAGRCIRVTH